MRNSLALIISFMILLTSFVQLAGQYNNASPVFVGHRGASYLAPQNTVASIQLAWDLGAKAAECDVMLSSDHKVVVFHDKNTKKLTGISHEVADTPWEVLKELDVLLSESNKAEYEGESIPQLSQLLATLPKDRMLVIEIKTGPEILPFLKMELDQHWVKGDIALISFDFDVVRQAKALYPDVPCYYLAMFGADANIHLNKAVEAGLDGLNLRHAIINEKLVAKCREAGLDLWCWTINDVETAHKMSQLGVSGITTDRPAWLREQISQ